MPLVTAEDDGEDLTARDAVSAGVPASVSLTRVEDDVQVYHTPRGVPISRRKPGAPLVHFGVFMRGGVVLDAPEREGLARLTSQAMLKGTTTRSGAQIAEAAESLGSSIGVSAGWRVGMDDVGAHPPSGRGTRVAGRCRAASGLPDDGVGDGTRWRWLKWPGFATTCTAGRCVSP